MNSHGMSFCLYRHLKKTNLVTRFISTSLPSSRRGNRLWKEPSLDPKSVNLQDMMIDAADPKVPPAAENENVTYWEPYTYPEDKHIKNISRDQSKLSYRPDSIDPESTSVFLFPGQGTQFVGMAKELMDMPVVSHMFDTASSILEFDLKEVCLKGPSKLLTQTQVQQPAILVASLAAVEKLREDNPTALENCVAAAGFSVGEITALTFAGAFTFEDAVHLIKVRSEAMQLASEMYPGGMMAAHVTAASKLSFACAVAKEFCQKRGVVQPDCKVASYLHPNLKVIAGNEEALSWLHQNMSEFAIRKLKRLNVSGAFHTNLMEPAKEPLIEVLKHIDIQKPSIPVHSNIDGRAYRDEKHIARSLPKQMCSAVKWEQTMHILFDRKDDLGYPQSYECGPGMSLRSILKVINLKASQKTKCVKA